MSDLWHLVRRFFDVLGSRPLTPAEQAEAAGWLVSDAERSMFWDQAQADQRHGLAAARYVASAAADRTDLIRAALLHDVGKRHPRLGTIGRVVASIVRMVGRRGSGRIGAYLDHGRVAAEELAAAGAEEVVVAYARHHHSRRPPMINEEDWAILSAADGV